MSGKLLRQDIDSRRRVEKFQEIIEEQTGFKPTKKDAEARLTKLGMKKFEEENMELTQLD